MTDHQKEGHFQNNLGERRLWQGAHVVLPEAFSFCDENFNFFKNNFEKKTQLLEAKILPLARNI